MQSPMEQLEMALAVPDATPAQTFGQQHSELDQFADPVHQVATETAVPAACSRQQNLRSKGQGVSVTASVSKVTEKFLNK